MKVIAKWLFLLLSFLFSHGQHLYPYYNGYSYWNEFNLNYYRVHTRREIFCPEHSSRVNELVRPGSCPVTRSNGFPFSICDTLHLLCCTDADCIWSTKCCHHNSFRHKVCLRPIPNFPITPGPAVVTEPSTVTTEPTTTFWFTEPLMTTTTNMPTTVSPTTTTTTTSITNPEGDDDNGSGNNDVKPEFMPTMNPTTSTTESTTQTATNSTIDLEFGGASEYDDDDDDSAIANPFTTTTKSTIQTTTNSIINTEDGSGSGSREDDDDDDYHDNDGPPPQ